jgi:hypothetical protein
MRTLSRSARCPSRRAAFLVGIVLRGGGMECGWGGGGAVWGWLCGSWGGWTVDWGSLAQSRARKNRTKMNGPASFTFVPEMWGMKSLATVSV